MRNENCVKILKEKRDEIVWIKNYFSNENRRRNWRSGCGPDSGFHCGKITRNFTTRVCMIPINLWKMWLKIFCQCGNNNVCVPGVDGVLPETESPAGSG